MTKQFIFKAYYEDKKGENMNVLICCEESQAVCKEFRKRGHRAFSCDIQRCSGGHPEWHIFGDCMRLINGRCEFFTENGLYYSIETSWDLIIAHPPCTYLTTAATQCHSMKCYTEAKIRERTMNRINAIKFFMDILNADCDKIAIENPKGIISSVYRKPDQYIQPYYFAESSNDSENYYTKLTGLWLKGLKPLEYNCDLINPMENAERWNNGNKKNWTETNHGQVQRSKTFPGIARAMAAQWG